MEQALAAGGFTLRGPNEWVHPGGSYVRVDSPHQRGGPRRSHNEPHYHKLWTDPVTKTAHRLDDRGYVNADPGRAHIIGRSPKAVRRARRMASGSVRY